MSERIGLLFNCEWCGEPIETVAGLLFSPPINDMVRKHHMCKNCYINIIETRKGI